MPPLVVRPPGPFLPHGDEPADTVDLGVRVRDQLFRRSIVTGPVRTRLAGSVGAGAKDLAAAVRSQHLVAPLLDTWPLGAMIEDARAAWTQGPDPKALTVLARASTVIGGGIGWSAVLDRRWPMPDLDWMREQVPLGDAVVVRRGPGDGAVGVSVVLELPIAPASTPAWPKYADVPPDAVVDRIDELVDALVKGDVAGVRWSGPAPAGPAGAAAIERLRAAGGARQVAFERYGLAGLVAGDAPTFESLLGAAPGGVMGDLLVRTCDLALIPRPRSDGSVELYGALLWDAPYAPLLVVAAAVEVLRRLDGRTPIVDIARELDVEEKIVRKVLVQLVDAGAATAVPEPVLTP